MHNLFAAVLVITGLMVFEIVNSLDNAVVNSGVLSRMTNPKARRFFVTWGLISSVFVVRGVVPLLIYYVPNRQLGFAKVMRSFWGGDPGVQHAVAAVAPHLLMAGGMFLALLFLHWLLVEEKDLGYAFERWLSKRGDATFLAVAGVLLAVVCSAAKQYAADPAGLMLAAVIGTAAFFVVNGCKEFAESAEEKLLEGGDDAPTPARRGPGLGDWGKVLFLEAIDASFSVDGVVGAFAFTLVVPYILIGNGIGAFVVRQLTLTSVDKIGKYQLLANGAFYSIGSLSALMVAEGFGVHVPEWLSPIITFSLVGFFLWRSVQHNRQVEAAAVPAVSGQAA